MIFLTRAKLYAKSEDNNYSWNFWKFDHFLVSTQRERAHVLMGVIWYLFVEIGVKVINVLRLSYIVRFNQKKLVKSVHAKETDRNWRKHSNVHWCYYNALHAFKACWYAQLN